MAVNMNVIAEKIMKFIRGNGLQVQMFDDQSGKSVADPTTARYFYVDDPNIMIFLDDKTGELKFHMGEDISLEDPTVSKISKNMKLLARSNMLDFDIRTFGKRIEPRHYGYKIEQNKEQKVDDVFESISPLEGSSRTSRQTLENAKIIVRHRAPVNEEQRGSRSRNISSIFIENNAGERFKYPFKHLSGARAMARHVSSGGNPMDTTGSAIVEMSENLYKLKEFMGIVSKQGLINEANRDVVFNVKRKINHIKETISKLSTSRGYAAFVESLALNETEEQQEITEDVINSYISKFTKSTFEESLKDILPLVHRVNEEEYRSNRDGQVQNIMQIISAKDETGGKLNKISFRDGGSYDFDKIKKQYKDNPQSQYSKMISTFQDLASRVDVDSSDDHRRKNKGHDRAAVISLFLNDIAEKLSTNPKSITKPEQQLATYFMKLSKVKNEAPVAESKSEDKFEKMLKESFSKYSVFEEFGLDEEVEGNSTHWEVSYDYGPHQSNTISVKAKSKEEAIDKAKQVAKDSHNHNRITSISVSPKKTNEGFQSLGEHTDYQSYVKELRDEGYSVYVSKISGGEGGLRFEIETPDGKEFEVIEATTGEYGLYRNGATMSGRPDATFSSLADAVHSME